MKKAMWAAVAVLLAWNVWLSVKVFEQPETVETATDAQGTTVISNTVNGYTTDLTKAVEKAKSKIVSVYSTYGEEEHVFSGVVYKRDETLTYIVTCASLVENCDSVRVSFDNGDLQDAMLMGTDVLTDIAVLAVQPPFETKTMTMTDSSLVRPGEYVISLGARRFDAQSGPVGFGVVSMQSGSEQVFEEDCWATSVIMNDIQADAYMNGAPLMNLSGEMMGMLTLKLTEEETGGYLSCAVASNEIQEVAEQLIENGSVSRGYLGIVGRNVSEMEVYEKSARNLAIDQKDGVLVTGVRAGSAAEKAGIAVGDVIVEFNESACHDLNGLRKAQYALNKDNEVVVSLLRGMSETKVTAILQ